MTDAIKCDRCGVLEEKYCLPNSGMYIATWKEIGSTKQDLCVDCKESFKKWWGRNPCD